ncbi:hypothetical protein ACFZDK_19915 [Streptomyces sp. NPDC007901]|uniref:hypothetical protein n=1 Tax=Streptomyces sp. NPDC007901 TaxID=3364785 RepID=UPI0036E61A27
MTPSLLETRYRTVLRMLPAYYRREREEEMVETYLCDLDREVQDQSRPTVGEVASVAALAVRSRLGAAGSPRGYELLGSAVRLFAVFAVLVQAAAAVVDDTLDLTWSTTRGPAQRQWFLDRFTDQGLVHGAAAAAQWTLPLLWAVAYFALLHDRRRLARAAALLAALPTLWPLAEPLVDGTAHPDPAFAATSGLLAWLTALALCAAYHRDAPPARLPVGSPGLVFLACCVVMGGCNVLVPTVADLVWTPATGFLAGGLAWLLLRTRQPGSGTPGGALALAALGLLILAVRAASLALWIGVPVPAGYLGGSLAQTAALALLTAALAVVGGRELAVRR